jgi:hypothetical protein
VLLGYLDLRPENAGRGERSPDSPAQESPYSKLGDPDSGDFARVPLELSDQLAEALDHFATAFLITATGTIAPAVTASAVTR